MAEKTRTTTNQDERWWARYIDVEMVPSKLTYLLCEGYMGSILPILNIFFVTLGLTPAQAGLITGTSFLVAAIFPPIWSCVIETYGYRKTNFIILCIGTALTVFSMPWIASSVANYEFNMTCPHPPNMTRHAPKNLPNFKKPEDCVIRAASTIFSMPWIESSVADYELNITCRHPQNMSHIPQHLHNFKPGPEPRPGPGRCVMKRILKNSNQLFAVLLILNIVARIFFITLTSYIDSIVVVVVKTREQLTTYGMQRVFGVVGFGVANFIAGTAVHHYHPHNMSPFVAAFYVFLPFILLLMPVGFILIGQVPDDTSFNRNNDNTNYSSIMTSFLKKFDTIILLITITVSGTALNMMFNFLYLFILNDLHSNQLLVTLIFLICMATQLIAFPVSGKLIRYVGSPILFIIVGVFSYFPRFMMMSYIKTPWLAIPINLIEPFGLAFNWAAQVELTYQLAPKEISLTAINIINTIHFVASSGIANIVGGFVYHKYGGRVLYRSMGIVCGIWSVVISLYYGTKYYNKRKTTVVRDVNNYNNEVAINSV